MLTFPYGYSSPTVMLTWDQMMGKTTVRNLHPEVLRRFKALIEFAATEGVPLGVGTGWRVQPDPPPPGFAKPGNSWHESCPVSPQSPTALAIDAVPASSWEWMEANCGAFGFRTFRAVNNEPWHIQPVEVSTSRRFATTLPPLLVWPLPGPPDQPNVPPPEVPVTDFLARLSDGQRVEKVGGVVRPVSLQEVAPGGPLHGEPEWQVPPDSDANGYANAWLGAAAAAYARSIGMA